LSILSFTDRERERERERERGGGRRALVASREYREVESAVSYPW
jgi:hypothetical protein